MKYLEMEAFLRKRGWLYTGDGRWSLKTSRFGLPYPLLDAYAMALR
jgi:hypothetical protein